MKKLAYLLIILPLAVLSGCNGDSFNELDSKLVIVDSQLDFTSQAGTGAIIIDAQGNTDISVTSDAAWCTVTVESGEQIKVEVEENEKVYNRTATLTITSGTKSAHVPVTQPGDIFSLSTYELSAGPFEGTYKVVAKTRQPLVVPPITEPWLSAYALEDSVFIHVLRNNPFAPVRRATVNVTSGFITQKIDVTQVVGKVSYEEFLGTYTMRYATTNAVVPNRSETHTVSLVEKEAGKTYYLRNILADADQALCEITVKYDEEKGVELLGQIMGNRKDRSYDFWFLPYSNNAIANYVAQSTTVGVVSTNVNVDASDKLKFEFTDNGKWFTTISGVNTQLTCAGFLLREYNGATTVTNVNGKHNRTTVYHMAFEQQ